MDPVLDKDAQCSAAAEQYYQALYRYCLLQLGGDLTTADDCVQETFLRMLEKKDTCLKLSVSDTGIGIRQEDIPRLFNRFFRGLTRRVVGFVLNGMIVFRSACTAGCEHNCN